jgi:hypothetical protein
VSGDPSQNGQCNTTFIRERKDNRQLGQNDYRGNMTTEA